MNKELNNIVRGKRVLFVSGIRHDQMSGGNTSTTNIISSLSKICNLNQVALGPHATGIKLAPYLFFSFPAILLVQLNRITRIIWLEFFTRASPFLWLFIAWKYLRLKPSVVIFNHHSTFIYSFLFRPLKKVYIWHDLPSTKVVKAELKAKRNSTRKCVFIERMFTCNPVNKHFVFSFSDQKVMKRLHKSVAVIIPVFISKPAVLPRIIIPGSWLLLGNWERTENSRGAEIFFLEYYKFLAQGAKANATFHVIGFGADVFIHKLLLTHHKLNKLNIKATPQYENLNDFRGYSLLAPILDGAGIKVKTLEAWSYGLPVIGTKQAFSGLPKNIWIKGGLMARSLKDMAHLCIQCEISTSKLRNLNPNKAFDTYENAVE